jgi:endonuclease/exonuclease/phosphatase family metal-dependent hydrolase
LLNPLRPLFSAAEEERTAMAPDVTALQAAHEQHEQAIANLQRAIEQLAQQQALITEAILHAVRGKWDAAQFGPYSVESVLVALNPALQGKVDAVPFDLTR